MSEQTILLCAILVPTLGALLLPLLGMFSAITRNWLALLMVAASLACSLALVPAAYAGHVVQASFTLAPGLSLNCQADGLAVFVAIVSSLISTIIVLYSMDYIRSYPFQNEYYLMVVVFLGAMMGLVFSANLILLYVFWEITAIASWRLIGFFREKEHVVRADKAFLVTAFGALAMLLGFIIIYNQAGSFDLNVIKSYFRDHSPSDLAVGLILLGILSKSATLPFHTWLPDAGVAPSPVTALLHAAVLVKIGVYVYARLFVVTMPLSGFWHETVLIVAATSALVSAAAALVDNNMKRIIAYSTVSQIAFIFLGLASGSKMAVAGALLYILMHGLAKGGLFLCAGIIEHAVHTKDIRQMGGLIRRMPWTAGAFLFCAFSVMGIPPFGGFFSKFMVVGGAVESGHPWIAGVFIVGAFMTLLYLFRLFNAIFMGEETRVDVHEGSPMMVASVAFLGIMGLAGGILFAYPSEFARLAVQQMLGVAS